MMLPEINITFNIDVLQGVIIVMGYLVAMATSGLLVRHFAGGATRKPSNSDAEKIMPGTGYDVGAIIGKCENLLTITLILANAFTGLALIFTAKSIVRSEDIKKDPRYYLGGTLVNFTYSVLMGFLIRIVLTAVGRPI